jgi:hypothetical protein
VPPAGGVPEGLPPGAACELEPLPMFGQFFVLPELVPELELEGVVDVELFDVEPELVPEFPDPEFEVVLDVVAALATSAPPAIKPELNAPMANALRRLRFMRVAFRVVHRRPSGR